VEDEGAREQGRKDGMEWESWAQGEEEEVVGVEDT
jgi:hypothetical protein